MSVFLCWSGRGIFIAKALKSWLEDVFEKKVHVLVSEEIEKGAVWFAALSGMLEQADCGLVCLTPEALTSPWIPYEAGALAKAVAGKLGPGGKQPMGFRAFTFLVGVAPGEVKGPLSAFQSTVARDEGDVRRLVQAFAEWIEWKDGARAEWQEKLNDRWDGLWQQLTTAFELLPRALPIEVLPELDRMFRRKTFEEPLRECVSQNWLARYDGARETWVALKARQPAVEGACARFAVDVYRALIAAVDAYASALSALVGRERFTVGADGLLAVDPPGLALAAERSRDQVLTLATYLLEGSQAPVFSESFRFETGAHTERRALIEAKTLEVQNYAAPNWRTIKLQSRGTPVFCPERGLGFDALRIQRSLEGDSAPEWLESLPRTAPNLRWQTSRWDLDRILFWAMATWFLRPYILQDREVTIEIDGELHLPSGEKAPDGMSRTELSVQFQSEEWLLLVRRELDRTRDAWIRSSGQHTAGVPLALNCCVQCLRDLVARFGWRNPTELRRVLADVEHAFPVDAEGGKLLSGLLQEIRDILAEKATQ